MSEYLVLIRNIFDPRITEDVTTYNKKQFPSKSP